MANEPTPPDPDQIIKPPPTSPMTILGLAAAVVLLLVVAVLVLKWMNRPYGPADAGKLPTLGDANAPLTMYEYGSFICEHCAKVRKVVKEVLAKYPGKVKLVYVSYAPGGQSTAARAAMAGICADQQGKFWEFAEIMFERQPTWTKEPDPSALWAGYATEVGMDAEKFARCMRSSATEKAVSQQMLMGVGQVIQQTPTFILGETRLVNPRVIEDFEKAINKELSALNASGSK